MHVSETNDLYILRHGSSASWLAPGSNGAATALNPQPYVLRAAYSRSTSEQDLSSAKVQLESDRRWLLALVECPDGPPHRSAFLFIYKREESITWRDGPYPRSGKKADLFQRATPVTSLGSESEGYGFFLTGSGIGSVWKLVRPEVDLLGRWVLTLAPVQFSSRCPQADFSGLKTALLADEVQSHYANLARAITANSYRAVVTDAKNIVEAIVAEKLGNASQSRDLAENLRAIKKLLEDSPQDGSCGWTYLEYHLAQKIRLVHGQTHATALLKTGRPLRLEFAMSTVDDLVELLYLWGYCTR